MPLRPCLTCGRLSSGRRCPQCTRARDNATLQAKRERRPYTAVERQRRADAVRAHVEAFGFVCPGWMTAAHPSMDLTADHPDEVQHGGDEGQALHVLCRSCNSRKSHSVTRVGGGAGDGS